MMNFFEHLFGGRLWGLVVKETKQTVRDKHLLFLLIFPPTIQLLLLGAALDPGVHDVSVGLVDHSRCVLSRSLVDTITRDKLFKIDMVAASDKALSEALQRGAVKLGVVIPPDFERNLSLAHVAPVQVLIDGTDAYSARIADGNIRKTLYEFAGDSEPHATPVKLEVRTLFNPDLRCAWYFIPGVMGAMLTLTSTLVSSATLLREKELGTLEQLLMTPYSVSEILLAKTAPIFGLLMLDAYAAVLMGMVFFSVPFRGSLVIFSLAAALYIFVGMGLGMMLATICKTERQSHLVSFFVNIPIMQLSGAVVPFETMPELLRTAAAVNPLRYFTMIARGLLLKGADWNILYPQLAILALSAVILFLASSLSFRRQIS
jgi:ABC-2 type transport system permease protein